MSQPFDSGDDTGPVQLAGSTPFTSATATTDGPPVPTDGELGLVHRDPPPRTGWRKTVHRATGLNPGVSAREAGQRSLLDRINQPVHGGPHKIAVLSQKGGVGKTTITVGLGATLAVARGDRIVAVDANPDFGTLAQRGPDETDSTVRDVLLDENIVRYSDMRMHTSQSTSRLEILASERDPATSEAFSESDYRGVLDVLQRFYNIILTDCGTGLVHSAMAGVLDEADMVVVVASPAVDSARSAWATLRWLERQGYSHLVPGATVVFSASRPGELGLDINQLARQFLPRVRAMHVVPFDDHLAEGSEIDLDLLSRQTRQAFLELAATIADGFSALHFANGYARA
ncbi:MinD/ParA family protein [Mycobacterium sp. CPCC 205710]|uniref:MinD/ParA family protein n=1 Tax=Mycobacterium deserti TaxID=2978347 RepID=A0ABT2MBR9_9MYCO|nr:MinD/ParA family protein [Mycobacterium deserti]